MGAQLSLSARTAPSIAIFSYIDVLNEVHYVSQLNSSMFLKTCKGLDPNGEVIIKVFIKPTENYDLKEIQKALSNEALILAPLPTALNFSKMVESNRAGYLVRQHLKSNLYDRLSSRPYLLEIELKFFTFQLLQALEDIHDSNIKHGDIKTENILVTSWGWLLLTDFSSSIKPTYLPEDNPGEFSFYFDTSKRRTCYLAPERFDTELHESSNNSVGLVTKKMDIFSLGCCIAEMNAEGRPLFNLSQLFKYKNKEYDVDGVLKEEINSSLLRNLISDMIQLDPTKRLSCKDVMQKYRGSYFPEYFYTFTYEYFRTLATMSTSTPSTGSICTHTSIEDQIDVVDGCCLKIYLDFGKICESLGYRGTITQKFKRNQDVDQFFSPIVKLAQIGVLDLHSMDMEYTTVKDECALLFISYLSHTLSNIVSSLTKLRCIEMLVTLSQFVSDENKIDRIVPYMISCFEDEYPNVQALAVQALTQILHTVSKPNPMNEYLFVDYLFPRIKRLLQQSKQNSYIRIVIANCLGDLVLIANRFQELSLYANSIQSSESANGGVEVFEVAGKSVKRLIQQVEDLTVSLLIDNETNVKVALLSNILPLCKFFGRERANDIILSHLITYLNDKDSSLRTKLIQTISGIAVLLGPITLEQYILPLLVQTITDSEELVVVNVIRSLKDLCKTGLIQKRFYYDICNIVRPLLLHPNFWIRQYSLLLIVEISGKLSKAEVYCVLYPIVRAFFEFDVEFTYDLMLSSCKQPISRIVYTLLCSWSLRAAKSLFWQQVPSDHVDAFGSSNISFITKDYSQKNYGFTLTKSSKSVVKSFDNSEIPLTTEDKNWIDKFRSIGLPETDVWKLAVLRGYISRTAKLISRKSNLLQNEKIEKLEKLDHLYMVIPHLTPRIVFFDISFRDEDESTTVTVRPENNLGAQEGGQNDLPAIRDLNGSLMFTTKAAATTTSNLETVYVQLECKIPERETNRYQIEENEDEKEFIVSNSYEGSIPTIKEYLQNLEILPLLREYKNFGPIVSDVERHAPLSSINGKLVTNLVENGAHCISSLATSTGTYTYLISGSDQGIIKLWDMPEIIDGEGYTSSISHEFGSSITCVISLPGYEAFCIATKEGSIFIMRVIYQGKDKQRKFTRFQMIRKYKIGQNDNDSEEYAECIKFVISDDKSLLVALTNTSKMLIIDIRTMVCIQQINNPVLHGAISSFALGENGSVIILGTTKGIIDVWDLRFNILIKSWAFGDHAPISSIVECDMMGSNMVLIVGGLSSVLFTIWNYRKLKCQLALIHSDEQPSIESFLPLEKHLDHITFNTVFQTNTIYIKGEHIVVADNVTKDFMLIDTKKLSSSRVLWGANLPGNFVPVQATTTLTYILLKKGNALMQKAYCNEEINCISSITFKGKPFLITADNSGIISIVK